MTVLSLSVLAVPECMTMIFTLMRRRLDTLPLTMIGLRPAVAPQDGVSVQLLLEQTYYFTFRNPKFGGDPSASRASLRSIPITMAQRRYCRLDTEGDMDDAGGLDDEDAQAAQPAARVARGTPLSSLFDSFYPRTC